MPFDQPKLNYLGLGQYETDKESIFKGRDITIVVPKGFQSDLATSPRIFWALVPPFGAYEAAALLHDWLIKLLKDRYRYPHAYPEPPVSAVDADGWFRRIMRESGVGFIRRWSMWAAVRLAALFRPYRRQGWLSWPETPLVLLIAAVWLSLAGLILYVFVYGLIHLIGGTT